MPLESCPRSPNCVSTLAEPSDHAHHLEALAVNQSADVVLDAVESIVTTAGGDVKARDTNTLSAVFTSPLFRFKDDVSFFVDEDGRRLHARSASRVGYSDLGANRKRVSALFGEIDSRLNAGSS